MSATVDILKAVKKKLRYKKNWIKNSFAKNAKGYNVHVFSKGAVCWCLIGAIHSAEQMAKSSNNDCSTTRTALVHAINKNESPRLLPIWSGDSNFYVLLTDYITSWNDAPERTHEEVLTAIDEAIKFAEKNIVKK